MRSSALAAIVLVAALAVPTAAMAVGEQETVGPVTLESTSQYATVEDGELRVDFDSLNDRATTRADGVFRIGNDAGEPVRVRVTVDAGDGVVTYRGGDPSNGIGGESAAVELSEGDSLSVGFEIDTHGSVPDAGAVTVHAEPVRTATDPGGAADGPRASPSGSEATATPGDDPNTTSTPTPGPGSDPQPVTPSGDANLSVGDLAVSPERVTAGESVRATTTVRNDGEASGTATIGLTADGDVVARRTVTVPAGTSRTVAFKRVFEGTGRLRLGTTVGAEARSGGPTADLLVNDRPSVRVERSEDATAGEPTTLRANVTDEVGNVTVTWLFEDGSTAAGRTVTRTLSAGEVVAVTATDEFGATARAERTVRFGPAAGGGANPSLLPYVAAADSSTPVLGGLVLTAVVAAALVLVESEAVAGSVLGAVAGYAGVLARTGPRVTDLSGATWDRESGVIRIDSLRVEADGFLETVEVTVTGADGAAVVRKTIDPDSGGAYAASPELIRVPGGVDAATGSLTLEVRAVDGRQRTGTRRQRTTASAEPDSAGTA